MCVGLLRPIFHPPQTPRFKLVRLQTLELHRETFPPSVRARICSLALTWIGWALDSSAPARAQPQGQREYLSICG